MSVATVNQFISILTMAAQAGAALLILGFIFPQTFAVMRNFVWRNQIRLGFIIVLIAMLGSLFYSEVAGYEPCKLCWFQRIFMYPQVLLLAVALFTKDNLRKYIWVMSGIGAMIAGYHYLLQLGIAPDLSCSAVGYSVSCAQRFVLSFGYITIPLMAFTAFALNFLIFLHRDARPARDGL